MANGRYDAQDAYQGFLNRGLSPTASAALAGNMSAESGFNPRAFNNAGGGQGALGIFQWRGDRQTNLKNFASTQGRDWADFDLQMDYIVDEIKNQPGHAMISMDDLNSMTDVAEGSRMFREKYLRPGEDRSGYATTMRNSVDYYNQYSGLDPQEYTAMAREPGPNLTFGKVLNDMANASRDTVAAKYGTDLRYNQLLMQGLVPGQYNASLMSMGELIKEAPTSGFAGQERDVPRDPRTNAPAAISSDKVNSWVDPKEYKTIPDEMPLSTGTADYKIGDQERPRSAPGNSYAGQEGAPPTPNPYGPQGATAAGGAGGYGVNPVPSDPAITTSTAGAPSPNPADYPVSNDSAPASGGGAATPNEGRKSKGLLDALMPLREGEEEGTPFYARQGFGDMLAAFSTGLGQMDAGQAVNVMPAVNDLRRIRTERQALDQKQQADSVDQRIAQQNADTNAANADVARQQVAIQQQELINKNQPMSPEFVSAAIEQYPQLAALGTSISDAAAAGLPTQQMNEKFLDTWGRLAGDTSATTLQGPLSPEAVSIVDDAVAGKADPGVVAQRVARLNDPKQAAEVQKLINDFQADQKAAEAGDTTSTRYNDAVRFQKEHPEDFPSVYDAWMALANADVNPEYSKAQEAIDDKRISHESTRTARNEIAARAGSDTDIRMVIADGKRIVDQIGAKGMDVGKANAIIADWVGGANGVAGGAVNAVAEKLGLPVADLNALEGVKAAVVTVYGRALLKGGGDISDTDIEMLRQAIVNPSASYEELAGTLYKLDAAQTVRDMADNAMMYGDADNFDKTQQEIYELYQKPASMVAEKARNMELYKASVRNPESKIETYRGATMGYVLSQTSQQLTTAQAKVYDKFIQLEDKEFAPNGVLTPVRIYWNTELNEYRGIDRAGNDIFYAKREAIP